MKQEHIIGKPIPRIESADKATGSAIYTADIKMPNMLFGKVLRSPYPHAKITAIDTSMAEALPGVKAVITYKNSPQTRFNSAATGIPVHDDVIFGNVVRYVGDEVAAVAAVSEEVALKALKLIEVDYEILPAVFEPKEAMKPGAPTVHECELGNNLISLERMPLGDIEKAFSESDIIVEEEFKLPVVKQCQLENHAAVAEVSASGKITVWSPTQNPHPVRDLLAKIFGVTASKVRVLNPYVGGGFGGRIGLCGKAEPIAVALAQIARKPVQVSYDRKEDFIASDTRHSGYVTVKLGAKKDGSLNGLSVNAVLNTGAYAAYGPFVMAFLGIMACTNYQIPNILYEGYCVYTNTTTASAMRGFGNPQGKFALESTIEIMAEKLGIDPMELRLKNMIKPFDKWVIPYPCATTGLEECIQLGAQRIGWERRNEPKIPLNHKVRGIGMAISNHVNSIIPWTSNYDNAYLSVQIDGSVLLTVGIIDMGQGIVTTLTQVAAEALGVPIETVHTIVGDTETTPYSVGSDASRSLYSGGLAVIDAADKLKKDLLDFSAEILKVDPGELLIQDGIISCTDSTKGQLTMEQVGYLAHTKNRQFAVVGRNELSNATPWAAHFAEVEVDLETGQVEVLRFVAAHDSGKIINPAIVEGQIEGGVLQGIGYALSEQIVYDDKGRQIQDSFHKYYMPSILETPEIDIVLVEPIEPTGPFGAKGVGELGLIPPAGAIGNAIANAIGVHLKELPMTEEKVLAAILAKKVKTTNMDM